MPPKKEKGEVDSGQVHNPRGGVAGIRGCVSPKKEGHPGKPRATGSRQKKTREEKKKVQKKK